MPKSHFKGLIPFDEKGNLHEYTSVPPGTDYVPTAANNYPYTHVIWKSNHVFSASLKIHDYSRGRSGASYIVFDENRRMSVHLKDFLHLVKVCTINAGVTDVREWTYCKQGQNYGVRLASVPLHILNVTTEEND